jgi:alpha-galactosidase
MAMPMPDPAIFIRPGEAPGARFHTGRVVLDEAFLGGRLCTRYWSAAGQVVPEMHAGKISWAADEPADSFAVSVDGQDLAGGYEWIEAGEEPDASGLRAARSGVACAVVRLAHPAATAEVRVHTRLDGGPFVVRWLEISNRSSRAVAITRVSPFAGMVWTRRIGENPIPGTAGEPPSPFELAYTHRFDGGQEGDFWFEPLPDGVKTVDGGRLGRSGWGRPAFWVRDLVNGQTLVCELAWGGNYEFSLDCRIRPAANVAKLFFKMGLSGHEEALRVLAPGETVRTPAVHVGFFQDDVDRIVQATHEHVRSVVMPAQVNGRHVEIEANHRGYLCDRENEPALLKDEVVAAAIGAEVYVIDAGWYGNDPNHWWNNAGDWTAGSWLTNGLEPVAAHARELGMRFGLWVEIEAAGANSTLKKQHPEWLLSRDGKPVNDRALDFSNPEVGSWAEAELERLIRQYGLELCRIDHNHTMSPSGNRRIDGHTEDLTWRYYENFAGMIARLRKKFPDVVFQNCAGGGGRLDWGTLGLFHNTELSDWARLPRSLRILNGVSMSLPPEILLRTFGTEAGEHDQDGDVDSQLRAACLGRPIFRGIAPGIAELTPFLKDRIDHHLDLYRSFIRPMLADCRVFHHTPFVPLFGSTPWCVLEYVSRDRRRGIAALFRTMAGGPDEFVLKPRGLRLDRSYRVTMDNREESFEAGGSDLVRGGVAVRLANVMSSELVLFEEARA